MGVKKYSHHQQRNTTQHKKLWVSFNDYDEIKKLQEKLKKKDRWVNDISPNSCIDRVLISKGRRLFRITTRAHGTRMSQMLLVRVSLDQRLYFVEKAHRKYRQCLYKA